MKRVLFLSLLSFFMVSCTPKNSAFRYFDKGDIEANAIRHTKKIDIVKDNQVDVIFIATHLNKIDLKLSEKEENFLVYVYFSNSESQELLDNKYEVLLNGKVATSIEKLQKDDEDYKELMLKNFWGNYYLMKFQNKEEVKDLRLTLRPKSSEATLNFEK